MLSKNGFSVNMGWGVRKQTKKTEGLQSAHAKDGKIITVQTSAVLWRGTFCRFPQHNILSRKIMNASGNRQKKEEKEKKLEMKKRTSRKREEHGIEQNRRERGGGGGGREETGDEEKSKREEDKEEDETDIERRVGGVEGRGGPTLPPLPTRFLSMSLSNVSSQTHCIGKSKGFIDFHRISFSLPIRLSNLPAAPLLLTTEHRTLRVKDI